MVSCALALLATSPASVQYLNALERLGAGDAPAAEKLARESTPALGPLQPYGELLLGSALAAQGKHEEALAELRSVAAADPAGPLGRRAVAQIALSLKALGRGAEALAALPAARRDELDLRLVELEVKGPEAPCDVAGFTLSECLLVDFPDRAPEPGVALPPKVRVARALALARRGQQKAARDELRQADASPEAAFPPALLARGLAGDVAALKAASLTAERDVAPEAGVLYARAIARGGQYAPAVQALDGVVAKWPGHPQAFEAAFLAAALERDAARSKEAVARWRRIAARPGPRSEDARWWAGWTLFQVGEGAAAAKELEPLAANRLSVLAPQALYWLGLWANDPARLREAASLEGAGYYSLWVEQRLGTRAPAPPAPHPPPARDGAEPPRTPRVLRARALLELGQSRDAAAEVLAELEAARAAPASPTADGAPPGWAALLPLACAAGRCDRALAAAVNTVGERLAPGAPTALVESVYPAAYPDAIGRAAAAVSIDPWLLTALARRESRLDEAATSPAGALGLFQLMPRTARRIAAVAGTAPPDAAALLNARAAAPYAAWYLSELLGRFRHPAVALAAYNAGPAAVERWLDAGAAPAMDRWVEEIPYRETRIYVKAVLGAWHAYHHLYGGEAPALATAFPGAPRDGARF